MPFTAPDSDTILLAQMNGEDRPGLTVALTEVLATYGCDILDIGQSVIHDTLTLGMLIRVPRAMGPDPIVKDLLFRAYELDVKIKFRTVSGQEYATWVAAQGKKRFIVTLVAGVITSEQLAAVAGVMHEHGLNIDVMHRLSGRDSGHDSMDKAECTNEATDDATGCQRLKKSCVELSVRGTDVNTDAIRADLMAISARLPVDIAFQEDNIFRRNRRLVAFDMDSTLVTCEVIDELAAEAGVKEQVSAITEAAMRGEFAFTESLSRRLALLQGLPEEALERVFERVRLTDGAEVLIRNLKRFGYKIALISGGFTYFGRKLQERLGIDYVYANELEIVDGHLTGRVVGDVVDGDKKAELLTRIAEAENISLQQVIAVGDGANDLPMLNLAGLGIAFHAKPVVRQTAGQSISTHGLDSILYLIGVRDRDMVEDG